MITIEDLKIILESVAQCPNCEACRELASQALLAIEVSLDMESARLKKEADDGLHRAMGG